MVKVFLIFDIMDESKSCEEIDISAYSPIGTVRNGVLNESKCFNTFS